MYIYLQIIILKKTQLGRTFGLNIGCRTCGLFAPICIIYQVAQYCTVQQYDMLLKTLKNKIESTPIQKLAELKSLKKVMFFSQKNRPKKIAKKLL